MKKSSQWYSYPQNSLQNSSQFHNRVAPLMGVPDRADTEPLGFALRPGPVLAGMFAGLAVALGLFLQRKFSANPINTHGLHEGVIGLLANLLVLGIAMRAGRTHLSQRSRMAEAMSENSNSNPSSRNRRETQ